MEQENFDTRVRKVARSIAYFALILVAVILIVIYFLGNRSNSTTSPQKKTENLHNRNFSNSKYYFNKLT